MLRRRARSPSAAIWRHGSIKRRRTSSASLWEEAKSKGDDAVKRLIDDALVGTTVTCVLIGSDTASRRWVQYEISASEARGNGLFGVFIHNIEDQDGNAAPKGTNPLPAKYTTHDWVNDNGYSNLGSWVDDAYDEAH